MPNYGYSTPYQGASGGLMPAGSMQAALEPGRNLAKGIESFGNNVWGMLEKYQKNKAEKEFASGELEGLISQFVPRDAGPPTGESGGPDVSFLSKMVGEKNVKKFVDGKATTADMLAMTHSIKTAQMQKDKAAAAEMQDVQKQILQGQLKAQKNAEIQQEIFRQGVKFAQDMPTEATTTTQPPPVPPTPVEFPAGAARQDLPAHLQLLSTQGARPQSEIAAMQTAAQPVTTTTQIPPDVQRQNMLKMLLGSNASPETLSLADSIMSLGGKTMPTKVAGGNVPGGGSWVTVNGKTEIFPPQKIEGKDLTDYQALNLSFSSRLGLNNSTVNKLIEKGFVPKSLSTFSLMPERMKSDDRKIYESAKENWIAAALRKESGAAINAKEYKDADFQYFPQEGDSKKVTAEKATRRNLVFNTMKLGIGKHGDEYMSKALEAATSGSLPEESWDAVKREIK